MTLIKLPYIRIILLILLFFPSYGFAQGLVHVKLQEFTETGDDLHIIYEVNISSHSIASGQGLRITPVLAAGDSLRILPQVTVLGSNKDKVIARWANNHKQEFNTDFIPADIKNDTTLYYSVLLPSQEWMGSAQLSFHQEILSYRGQSTMAIYTMNRQAEFLPQQVYHIEESGISPSVSLIVPLKEEKRRNRQGEVYIEFPVGRSEILPSFGRNPQELPKIDDLFRELSQTNKDIALQSLLIEGYASPEGSYQTNAHLAEERALTLRNYIKDKFGLKEDLFKVTSISEDWQGLARLVQTGDLPEKDKVLEIISTIGIFEGRKEALIQLNKGIPYGRMLNEMFPKLRRVEYRSDYPVRDYNVSETKDLLQNKPEDLSQLELYNLAVSYGNNSKEYRDIFLEIIPRYFPDDETANNNAAAILILDGELSAARRYLEKAGQSAASINNRGVILMLEGDPQKAEEYFKQSQRLGNEEAVVNLRKYRLKQ